MKSLRGSRRRASRRWNAGSPTQAKPKRFAALSRHDLRLVLGHRPFTVADVDAAVARAVRLGADFVFAQPADAFTPLATVAELVRHGQQAAAAHGLPFFVETHRNNFTETIPQTVALLDAVPEVRLTGDLSHFVVVGEFYGWADERAGERMMPVLEKVSHLHGRVSNGEAVQVDVGDGSTQAARFFVSLWTIAMRHWLAEAKPGDVFPFAPELGPPSYAITLPDGREFSDRVGAKFGDGAACRGSVAGRGRQLKRVERAPSGILSHHVQRRRTKS